ncbi:MAG: hypothetical protein AMJ75_06490 [Phycisphaerae bacterium SM1_79]|nr:MAG: hypothetical protein AMJ75_06490 [Phycisphaerae bacterium SM1_79]
MDLRPITNYIDLAQVDTELLSRLPALESQYTVKHVIKHVPRAVPSVSMNLLEKKGVVVVGVRGASQFPLITISPPEDPRMFGFDLLAVTAPKEIIELAKNKDFAGALSKIAHLFSGAWQYTSKVPQEAGRILDEVLRICARIPLGKIAAAIGADGYSIAIGLPPTISFSFAVKTGNFETNLIDPPTVKQKSKRAVSS